MSGADINDTDTIESEAREAARLIAAAVVFNAEAGWLWMSNGGELICARHAGQYLGSAIYADPNAEVHHTPITSWWRISADDPELSIDDGPNGVGPAERMGCERCDR